MVMVILSMPLLVTVGLSVAMVLVDRDASAGTSAVAWLASWISVEAVKEA